MKDPYTQVFTIHLSCVFFLLHSQPVEIATSISREWWGNQVFFSWKLRNRGLKSLRCIGWQKVCKHFFLKNKTSKKNLTKNYLLMEDLFFLCKSCPEGPTVSWAASDCVWGLLALPKWFPSAVPALGSNLPAWIAFLAVGKGNNACKQEQGQGKHRFPSANSPKAESCASPFTRPVSHCLVFSICYLTDSVLVFLHHLLMSSFNIHGSIFDCSYELYSFQEEQGVQDLVGCQVVAAIYFLTIWRTRWCTWGSCLPSHRRTRGEGRSTSL